MLKKLYDNDYPRLMRLAFSMAGEEGEDMVQDSFIKMIPYQHLSYGEAQALITTIVKNKCRDWLKHQKYVRRQMEAMPEPERKTILLFEAKDLKAQVNSLPADTRFVIEQRFYEGLTLREIGKLIGRDHASVYSRIQTGLRKLKTLQ